MRLPVDAYYPELQLVVEYCERQHTEAIPFMDRRMTISGADRGMQRAIHDQRRRDVRPPARHRAGRTILRRFRA